MKTKTPYRRPDRRNQQGRMMVITRLDTSKPDQKWIFDCLEEIRLDPNPPYHATTIRNALFIYLSLLYNGDPEPLFQHFPLLRPLIASQHSSNGSRPTSAPPPAATQEVKYNTKTAPAEDANLNYLESMEDFFNEL